MKTSTPSLFSFVAAFTLLGCDPISSKKSSSPSETPLAPLTVETFTSNDAGFVANSHLISGSKDAILIDAQFTLSEAKRLTEWVVKSGKNLTKIVISHAHPDHYFGVEELLKAFPNAKVEASQDVVEEIKETAPGKLAYWKPLYQADLTNSPVVPQVSNHSEIQLEGQKILISQVQGAEAESEAVFQVPSANAWIGGDLVYSGVHLWLAEGRADQWLASLQKIQKELPAHVKIHPGHGTAGGVELLQQNIDYIKFFTDMVHQHTDAKAAAEVIKSKYPDWKLPVIVDFSTPAYFK